MITSSLYVQGRAAFELKCALETVAVMDQQDPKRLKVYGYKVAHETHIITDPSSPHPKEGDEIICFSSYSDTDVLIENGYHTFPAPISLVTLHGLCWDWIMGDHTSSAENAFTVCCGDLSSHDQLEMFHIKKSIIYTGK